MLLTTGGEGVPIIKGENVDSYSIPKIEPMPFTSPYIHIKVKKSKNASLQSDKLILDEVVSCGALFRSFYTVGIFGTPHPATNSSQFYKGLIMRE